MKRNEGISERRNLGISEKKQEISLRKLRGHKEGNFQEFCEG